MKAQAETQCGDRSMTRRRQMIRPPRQ